MNQRALIWILIALLPIVAALGLLLRWWLFNLGVPAWAL